MMNGGMYHGGAEMVKGRSWFNDVESDGSLLYNDDGGWKLGPLASQLTYCQTQTFS